MKKIILFIVLLTTLISCKNKSYNYFEGETQGTTYHITFEESDINITAKEIDSVIAQFSKVFSTYDSASIISRINYNDSTVEIGDNFKYLLKVSEEVYKQSDKLFDITIAPIVNAWGFGFKTGKHVDSLLIDSLLQYVGYNKIRLSGNKIIKQNPNIMLDGNAIAQGYSVDIVAKYLECKNVKNYLVEIGGELKAVGVNENGNCWRVGIDKPIENSDAENRELQTIIAINNLSLATSGNYRKFFVENGVKYAHTINPKTGYPVKNDLLSVTVLCKECIYADAYATTFMVMGYEQSKTFVESRPDLEAYFIYTDNDNQIQEYYTSNFKKMKVE
ncbi:MAG: hypothetical protein A2046_16935 [Bacteroidetes bacterium GWA2_30_7]|nr:MAG: hypothetical protein A2046_16935 [Bacteroidetes bacterium GWA2_30_7]